MKRIVALLLGLLILGGCGYFVYTQYLAYTSDDFADAQDQVYLIGARQISEGTLSATQKSKFQSGIYYLSLEALESHFDIVGDYDAKLEILRLFKGEHLAEFRNQEGQLSIDGEGFKSEPILLEGETVYVPLNGLEDTLRLTIVGNAAINAFMVVEDNSGYGLIESYGGTKFYKDPLLESRRFSSPEGGLIPIGVEGEVLKVISSKLVPYYTSKDLESKIAFKAVVPKSLGLRFRDDEPIVLFWEYVGTRHPNTADIPDLAGANVSSPTWLKLLTGEGDIQLNYSDDYVAWAKSRDIDVWPLITNDFDPDKTSVLLNDMAHRDAFMDQLLAFLVDNNLKGVNIDFEDIHLKDQGKFTVFMAELVYKAHQHGIIVSIDVTVPDGSDNWSKVFDREKIGWFVDYMMVMTYDQYWASSPISGTVSGITWMKDNMRKIMTMVPKEKLVLGIPLYTRVWTESLSSTEPNKMKTKSKAITMKRTQEIIAEKKLTPIWDEENGQYFVSYFEGESIIKIWIEDLKSLQLKASLYKTLDLAGVACWRRGFEMEGTWPVIDKAMKGE
jgi:spore germination protein YaaH